MSITHPILRKRSYFLEGIIGGLMKGAGTDPGLTMVRGIIWNAEWFLAI
jgi:hypothetical protein